MSEVPPPPIGRDLPIKQPDFNKPVEKLEQITEASKLVLFNCYAIKSRVKHPFSVIYKEYIAQYLGENTGMSYWLFLYEREPEITSKWKAFNDIDNGDTNVRRMVKETFDGAYEHIKKRTSNLDKPQESEPTEHFKISKDGTKYTNVVVIDLKTYMVKDFNPNADSIAIYELGYGGDMISAKVSPEIATFQLNAARSIARPISNDPIPSNVASRIKHIKTARPHTAKSEIPVLPDVLAQNVNRFLAKPPSPPNGGKTTRKIKPRMRHRTRKPKHSRRYKRRNHRKSRRRV